MAKFRKKPIVIDAEQFDPLKKPWLEGVFINYPHKGEPDTYGIETLEGEYKVTPGDWIITGVEGERYPCKDGIFQKTYESVNDADGNP